MMNIAVLVSGEGTNLQKIIDAIESGQIKNGRISIVISSKDGAYALERAKKHCIKSIVMPKEQYSGAEDIDRALLSILAEHDIGLVVLAGYLRILGNKVIKEYANRIINIHPSLVPSFCGAGYYGIRVHRAALDYGVKVTGATVHFVNEVTDGGAIIMQRAVDITPQDTPETLQLRVMEQAEWILLPKAVGLFCDGKLSVDGRNVIIEE